MVIESPGRINLIGEHTDYNMGFVLPTAINRKIRFKFRINNTKNKCVIRSGMYSQALLVDLRNMVASQNSWENYILGVLLELRSMTDLLRGFDCYIESDIPMGSGISSSAALECGLAYGLNHLFDLKLSKIELVKLCQKVEHVYVGTQCGIMDQFASVMSKQDYLILLDCRSLEYSYIPLAVRPYKFILINTNVIHNLATSAYNERRAECEAGVHLLQVKFDHVSSLRDVSLEMLLACKSQMSQKIYNRCTYVIEENQRVLDAVQALKDQNLPGLGELLFRSHEGLRNLYEVSCPELDFLVDFASTYEGVIGARVMGGGFGGCTINMVHEDCASGFIDAIRIGYKERFNIDLTAFEGVPCGGTSIV